MDPPRVVTQLGMVWGGLDTHCATGDHPRGTMGGMYKNSFSRVNRDLIFS